MNELAPKDKRTKEYKDWVKKHQSASSGLGDTVDKITKVTGVKKAVNMVFDAMGKDCGCEKRKEKLNEVFRYTKPECFTKNEFMLIKEAVDTKKNTFNATEQEEFKNIYERVFNKKVNCTPCSFAKTVYKDLVSLYKLYL